MKKLLFIFTLFISVTSFSQQHVTAPLVRNAPSDTTYALLADTLLNGSLQVVLNKTNRNAIPFANRKNGMLVITSVDDSTFQLQGGITNSNWVALSFNGTTYAAGYGINILGTTISADTSKISTIAQARRLADSAAGAITTPNLQSVTNVGNTTTTNIFANNVNSNLTVVTATNGTTTLTSSSSRIQDLTGVSSQSFQLPNATTLVNGFIFEFNNNASGTLTVVDNGSNTISTIPKGGYAYILLTNNTTTNGSWDKHFTMPSNASYGTNGMTITGTLSTTGLDTYSSNLGSSYTSRTKVDKNYVDSSNALNVKYADTSSMLSPYRRTSTKITNSDLANSTISGVSLGSNLNALSNGYGITTLSYNGSATGSVIVDSTKLLPRADSNIAVGYITPTFLNSKGYGTGSVTSVATGYGLSGGTITTTGTLIADSTALSSKLNVLNQLNKYTGSSNIVTVGTITTGVWNATAIADTYIASASTWNGKQAALSGTGFVKISGTTISYDNSTYLTGNQTITLSGDVSGSGTTAITTAIGAGKVTNAMLAGSINYSKMDGSTVPTWNQNTTGSAATLTTARTISGTGEASFTTNAFDGSANVSGIVTLSNSAVIGKVLTGYVSGAGTVSATDNILQAIQKLNGNISALTTGVSSVNGGTGAVTLTVTGTTNRISVTGGTGLTPTIDISSSYVGQSSITTVGTLSSGSIPYSLLTGTPTVYSSFYLGTTNIPLNRSSGSQSLTGINIDGTASNITASSNSTLTSLTNSSGLGLSGALSGTTASFSSTVTATNSFNGAVGAGGGAYISMPLSSNNSSITFSTNHYGVSAGVRLTIDMDGAATFSSSVTTQGGESQIGGSNGRLMLYAGNYPSSGSTLNQWRLTLREVSEGDFSLQHYNGTSWSSNYLTITSAGAATFASTITATGATLTGALSGTSATWTSGTNVINIGGGNQIYSSGSGNSLNFNYASSQNVYILTGGATGTTTFGTAATFASNITINGGNRLYLNNSSNSAVSEIYNAGGASIQFKQYGSTTFNFADNGAMSIYSSTGVTPFTNITVGSGGQWQMGQNIGGDGTNDTFGWYSYTLGGGSALLQLYSTGKAKFTVPVTISNTTSSTNYTTGALVVSGGVGIAGAVYANSTMNVVGYLTAAGGAGTSDKRLKDTTVFNFNLSQLDNLHVYQYHWNTLSGLEQERNHYSVFAQEVEKIAPDLVFTANDSMGKKSVNFTELHTLEIERLKQRISEQNDRIERLEKAVFILTHNVAN